MRKETHPSIALLGKKIGMTQIFKESGISWPVTVIQVGPCSVLQKKTNSVDGYEAVQLGFLDKKKQRILKPEAGHAAKSKSPVKRIVQEVRIKDGTLDDYTLGAVLDANVFKTGDFVDVSGVSIGKGFQGVVKRHNFNTLDSTHNHERFRHPGSIGQGTSPGKVIKGKKMPGHQGARNVSVQNLEILDVQPEINAIVVKGAVPGAKNGIVTIKASRKGKFAPRSVKPEAPKAEGDAPTEEAKS